MNEYYVYAYLDPNKPGDYVYGDYKFEYEPFYIGKGKKNRMFYHLSKRSLKKNSHKNDKINENELILENKQPKIIKILDGLCEMDSYKYEIEIIKSIGRILDGGVLTNKTLGGEGSLGTHISVETREKCRKASSKRAIFIKGKTYEEIYGEEKGKELRELNGKYRVGKTYEDIYGEEKANDIRLKQSKSQKGKKKISEEGKKKLREISKLAKIVKTLIVALFLFSKIQFYYCDLRPQFLPLKESYKLPLSRKSHLKDKAYEKYKEPNMKGIDAEFFHKPPVFNNGATKF